MHFLSFKHNGQKYCINMNVQTLENKTTGKVLAIHKLRDYGLIAAVNKCIDNAERQKIYELIAEKMINNLRNQWET